MFEAFIRQAIFLTLICTAAPLLVSAIAGLFISLVQAATQIQEQTIVYVSKLGVLCGMLFLFGTWVFQSLQDLVTDALRCMVIIGSA